MERIMKKLFIASLLIMFLLVAAIEITEAPVEEIEEGGQETIVVDEAVQSVDDYISLMAIEYGVEEWIAREIMRCESELYGTAMNQNKRADGSVWSVDVGHWQINDYYHKEVALSMGLDIYDELDNIKYGFWLYSQEGAAPWSASKGCHGFTS